jgi:hypothetical protein
MLARRLPVLHTFWGVYTRVYPLAAGDMRSMFCRYQLPCMSGNMVHMQVALVCSLCAASATACASAHTAVTFCREGWLF